jgi:hypothetical protein
MVRLLASIAAASMAAACTFGGADQGYPSHGEATAHNAAVMIIDPNPPGAQNTDIPMDGSRAVLALERYQTDTVTEPEVLDTTDALSAGTD